MYYARLILIFFHLCLSTSLAIVLAAGSAQAAAAQDTGPCPEPCPQDHTGLENALLPDLQTLPPYQLSLVNYAQGGRRILRFSNSIANTGAGAMELRGELDEAENLVRVSQFISAEDDLIQKDGVGVMQFHDPHGHWHWSGFSIYEVWTVGPDAKPVERVAGSDKVSYCLLDSERIAGDWLAENRHNPIPLTPRGYHECLWRRQGITPGWMDTYLSHLEGQSIDITPLRDGLYALVSTVNPEGVLYEASLSNNSATTYFSLEGKKLQVITDAAAVQSRLFAEKFKAQPAQPLEPRRINIGPPVPW